MSKVRLPSGAVEYLPDDKTKELKEKHKGKKASDLSSSDVKELTYELAKRAGLI